MTYFPLYPYHTDPLRILANRKTRAEVATTEEVPRDPPTPASDAILPELDSGRGTAPHSGVVEGQGDAKVASESAESAEDHSTTAPSAPRSLSPGKPEEDEDGYDLDDWLDDHWDTVKALVDARQAPKPPVPPEPPSPPGPPPPPPVIHVRKGDRWNKPKMAEFLRQLAATHSVTAAARAVGMSRNSAYKLRTRLKGQPFDIAWEAAFRHGYDDLPHAALELALEGEEVPHYYQGELKGTYRKRSPQLIIALLRMRNRAGAPMLGRYGAAAEFWSERWEQMVHRVETGPVTWDEEKAALGEEEMARLDLPDETREIDRIIARNRPDDPRGFGKP